MNPKVCWVERNSWKGFSGGSRQGPWLCSLPHVCNSLLPSHAGCPHCKKVIPHFTATADAFKNDRKVRTPFLFISRPTSSFPLPPVPTPSSLLFRCPPSPDRFC